MFREDDVNEDFTDVEGYSISAWGQFQAAADSLRGYVYSIYSIYILYMHILYNMLYI